MPAQYTLQTMTRDDTRNTRIVINTMRDIARASQSGRYAEQLRCIARRCFGQLTPQQLASRGVCARTAEQFVREHVRYQADPADTEYIQWPHVVYREGYGDCDDMTVLWAALMLQAGHGCTIEAVRYRGRKYWGHVYGRVGRCIYDATLPPGEAALIAGDKIMRVSV